MSFRPFKLLFVFSLFFLFSAFQLGATPLERVLRFSSCETIQLAPLGGLTQVTVKKSDLLLSPAPFKTEVSRAGLLVTIKDLNVQLERAVHIDTVTHENFGWVHVRETKSYWGTHLKVTADEDIDIQVVGDIGHGVKFHDAYVICTDVTREYLPQ